jgi:3-deoxy-D-manno-octulosonic acid kinase
MNPTSLNQHQHHILFDSDSLSGIVPQWFTPEYWQGQAKVRAVSSGRGRAWFIDGEAQSMVLRHYQRGGAIAALLGDRYLWQGLSRTRAWREWQLLAELYEEGLPVPQPLAAHVIHNGLFYRADLLTRTIANSQSLSARLGQQSLEPALWQAIGQLIRRFHAARVYHADLNAHNILLDTAQRIYLIDFDKGKIMSPIANSSIWQRANLQRLQRSLHKLRMQQSPFHFAESDWQAFMRGYTGAES